MPRVLVPVALTPVLITGLKPGLITGLITGLGSVLHITPTIRALEWIPAVRCRPSAPPVILSLVILSLAILTPVRDPAADSPE